jgi:hypothetical protein
MRFPRLNFIRFLRAGAFFGYVMAAVIIQAAQGGFSATLSADQKDSVGISTLTADECAALDQLVAAEVALARKENSVEYESTFVARRTDEQRKQAGLDRLTPDQLTTLNGLVANAVAASPKPKERPRIKDSEVFSAVRKPEVHGEFSLTYGRTSGGGDFRAASMWVDYFDPNSGLAIGIGVSRSSGKGLYGFCPDYYPGFGYGGYGYGGGLGFYGSPFRNFGRDDLYDNDSRIYGMSADWDSSYYRGFRRR